MDGTSDSPEHVIDIIDLPLRNNSLSLRRRKSSPKMSESNDDNNIFKKKLTGKISGTSTISSRSSITSITDKARSVHFQTSMEDDESSKQTTPKSSIFKRSISTVKFPKPIEKRLSRKTSGQTLDSEKKKSKSLNDSTAAKLNEELEKVKEITREKQQNEKLISRILPREVSKQLASGSTVEPKPYENVTVYFSDIVGYTNMVSTLDPIQVFNFLSISSLFDIFVMNEIGLKSNCF